MRSLAGALPNLPAVGALCAGAAIKAALRLDCPMHATTGLLCPGCGTTRACLALLHGRVGTAARDNALFVGLLVLAGTWLVAPPLRRSLSRVSAGREWPTYLGVALMLLFAVLRNVPAMTGLRPLAT